MIPERTAIEVDSTVKGEDVAMSIDQSALAHIMNVLTDLYADPELAVIREYATNALDSHIEAGQTRPIEVTTPTDLRPLFTVRDYGVGLDADDIRDIYSRYGASTKRQTNDAVGMLGLGCKSALAYVDQFTLAGIKGGERMLVSIARDETGAGTMTVLEAGPTDEPDGVEVAIPVSAYNELDAKAQDFFAYWQPGTVLLNGEEPYELSGYKVGDYVVSEFDRFGRGTAAYELTVVMGNVSYPAPEGFENDALDSLPDSKRLTVRVPIGAVHFTPSREGLQDSERTRSAIHAALAGFGDAVNAHVRDSVEQAPSRPAAAKALIEAREAFGKKNVGELQWHGEDIPTVVSAEDLGDLPEGKGKPSIWRNGGNGREYRGELSHRTPAGQISLDDAGANIWILGFDNQTWTAPMRRKLNRYMEHHGLSDEPSKQAIYITNAAGVPNPEWIDGAVTAVNWSDIREWKDPDAAAAAAAGGGVKYAGTYPVYYGGVRRQTFAADDLPKFGRNLYYFEGDKWDARQSDIAALLSDDAYLVCVTRPRAAKFKRLFPHARDGAEAVSRGAAGWLASLSDDQRAGIAFGDMLRRRYYAFGGLPPERVDDPALAKLQRALACWEDTDLSEQWAQRSAFSERPALAETGIADWEATFARYLLAQSLAQHEIESNLDHVIMYVNAVYAANNEEES